MKATVRGGRLVVNQRCRFPEGTVLELTVADAGDELDARERKALNDALDRSWASARAGRRRPVTHLLRALRKPR